MAADQRRQAGAGPGAATPYNKPNLSPKGSLKLLDDNHLLFADIASPNTTRNLRHNPAIEINIVDPLIRCGLGFKGVAELSTDPALIKITGEDLGAEYPVRLAVKIRVEKAAPVRSPVCLFHNAAEEQLRETWMEIYGFRPRNR
jgi:uncharacterized protein